MTLAVFLIECYKTALPETIEVITTQFIFSGNCIEVTTDNLCRRINHAIGVSVKLHEGLDALHLLYPFVSNSLIVHLGNNDLTTKKGLALLFTESIEVDALQLGREHDIKALFRLDKAELGIGMGYSKGLFNAYRQQG